MTIAEAGKGGKEGGAQVERSAGLPCLRRQAVK